jgi:hypothetical protein
MGKAKQLSLLEKTKIDTLLNENYSANEILDRIGGGRSLSTIYYYLNKSGTIRRKRNGQKRKLSTRADTHIARLASNSNLTSMQIKANLQLEVSKSTILRSLRRCEHIRSTKKRKTFLISKANILKRLEFSRLHQTWVDEWNKVLFSDEKRFSLDGPDCYSYYWHDLRKEKLISEKSQSGSSGVMVWAGFGSQGKTDLVYCTGKMNSVNYQNVLEHHMIDALARCGGPNCIFQHDNAPIHSSKSTKEFLLHHNVVTMTWPANSPDLNPQEEVWSAMARIVYANNRSFTTIPALKMAINAAWEEISLPFLNNLLNSLPNRMYEVILNHGHHTHY